MRTIDQMSIEKKEVMLAAIPNYVSWTALDKHAFAFGEHNLQGAIQFSSNTIANRVKNQNGPNPTLTGTAVNFFNTFVSGQCPFGKNTFSMPGETTDYKFKLHAGTFEIFNRDGSVNNDRLNTIAAYADPTTELISLSVLLKNLKTAVGGNKFDANTRRNHGVLSRKIEAVSNESAWEAIFKLLAHQWILNGKNQYEPVIHAELLKLFFTDTPVCFMVASELQLPVQKPAQENKRHCAMS
ncbi:MAG: hypothetical protein A3C44_04605 [Gammaproteobacteria bacterium RIFCSPHIGHO2_02_FULL_39_13]|nr:MAG: hypothetical protein A3C44_04605 [Gammaproteobacteria bacterium RIFCSPHIGHO2_02_FULL_39_13]OGT50412.1 MAG: hypothetical protein A3E53_04420 [Gammaproteobacteria bacterium RIFCSPHIGHO2_12_FULL_39_24]